MSSDRDATRIVRSWMEEGATVLPDRVLDAVLDQLPTTQQRRARWPEWRFPGMNNMMRIAVVAAAVAVAAVLGVTYLGRDVGGPPPGPPPGSPTPTETALPAFGRLVPGTYVIDDPFPLRVSMTVPEGWEIWSPVVADGAAIYDETPDLPDGRGIVVVIVDNVYANPCNPSEGELVPQLGPTVDDLVSALTSQPRTDATTPIPVTLDGYSGMYVDFTATPAEEGCTATLHRFQTITAPRVAVVNERDQVWILDVDGVRLMIDAFSFPGASPTEMAELQQVVDSIQIEP